MWIRLLLLLFALNATLVANPRPAAAQADEARAVELITEANKRYDAGAFQDALDLYQEAYSITRAAQVLYRIGITYENLANYQRAREHLELYLLAEPDSQYAGRVKAKIEQLRTTEKTLQAAIRIESTPDGAQVWVDSEKGRPTGITPVRIPVGPGEHPVLVRKEGFEDIRDVVRVEQSQTVTKVYDLGAGAVAEVPTDPDTPPKPDATSEAPQVAPPASGHVTRVRLGPSQSVNVLSWISVAVGLAILGGSTGFWAAGGVGGIYGSGFFLGAGLVTLGGYFLWFRDYTRDLPPAPRGAPAPAAAHGVGIGLRF